MTIKASDVNKLLCDNNTVKTHHVNQSYFFQKTWLSRQDLAYKDLKAIKARQTSPMTKKALDTNGLLCDNNTIKTHQSVRLLKKNLAF